MSCVIVQLLTSHVLFLCLGVCMLDVYYTARWYNMDSIGPNDLIRKRTRDLQATRAPCSYSEIVIITVLKSIARIWLVETDKT
jgi:hypothetical protein